MIPLIGYANRLSAAPGQSIEFKVSCTAGDAYDAQLVRIVCGDPNPDGPGIKETPMPAVFSGRFPARVQPVHLGSYVRVDDHPALRALDRFSVLATIWPTAPERGPQGIVAKLDSDAGAGFALMVDEGGGAAMVVGDGKGAVHRAAVGKPMRARAWYRVWATYDGEQGALAVGQHPLQPALAADDAGTAVVRVDAPSTVDTSVPLLIAALGGDPVGGHFNGKIEDPGVLGKVPSCAELQSGPPAGGWGSVLAAWDFSREMRGMRALDTGPNRLLGVLVNAPARAMTGARWSGREMCWRHAPREYGAIHFHDDDLHDCGWSTDFTLSVPQGFKSGVYAMRLACGEAEEMIPFFVRAPRGRPQARACVLIPTFTYVVYANYSREVTNDAYRARVKQWGARPWNPDEHPEYGLSTYNYHSDGSGICYSSRLRPILNMRSGFLAYVDPRGSGLRHFPADTHLIDWLEEKGHDYDVITDEDLHAGGRDLIAPYKVVMTTSHPEYHTRETLDALSGYTAGGGRLMYLGGNGFYWRVALHQELEGIIEIRRGEGGIRAWAAEPGEYFNGFDGEYGGLWRRNGRPPQRLAGVGFTSQGDFEGTSYQRLPASSDPRVAWIFEGVEGEAIGGFGLSGGGAAGFELDRADPALGTPGHAVVLASSRHHGASFILVHEEQLTHIHTLPGDAPEKLIRADMVYFETPNGGAVFSVGSITFCGSLSHNGYDNDISRITDNVLTRFQAD